MGRDPLVSKTVVITGGPYKGYIGICKEFNGDNGRIELHSCSKVVNIPRAQIAIPGEAGRPSASSNARSYNEYSSYGGGKTPMHRPDGGRTPAWDTGSKTPAWNPGSKTPAWDAGSKTPAWEAGSKTPAWESNYPSSYSSAL